MRRTQPDYPSHTVAFESVARLLIAGEPVYFTLQNISEFWNVATRPVANNGMGLSVVFTLGEVEKIERILTLLPESPAIYGEWKRLVVAHNVLGSKVQDTKLVAAMNVHGLRKNPHLQHGRFQPLCGRSPASGIRALLGQHWRRFSCAHFGQPARWRALATGAVRSGRGVGNCVRNWFSVSQAAIFSLIAISESASPSNASCECTPFGADR
jgi:hypothetical protein